MKLTKILSIDGSTIDLTGDTLVLEEGAAGRGIFSVISDAPVAGICTLSLGYQGSVARYFTGLVLRSVAIDRKQQRITVAEFSAALQSRQVVVLRNATARSVLKSISESSGLGFSTGRRRVRLETIAVEHDRNKRTLSLEKMLFSPGQTIYIYLTDGSGYAEKKVVEIDSEKKQITYDTPLPAEIEITADNPAKIVAYDTTEEPAWLDSSAGHFVNLGTGFEALHHIAGVYGIEDPVALGQPDGSLYFGSYQDSGAALQVLHFASSFFTNLSATGADCAVIPNLRPGQRIVIGGSEELRITRVTISGNNMRINF